MRHMFDRKSVVALQERMARLTVDSTGRWGSLSVSKMVCHLADQMRFALSSDSEVKVMKGPPMVVRHLIRLYLPWPKGAPTIREMMVTDPQSLENDIRKASWLMDDFFHASDQQLWPNHPFFGPLDGKGWAKLTWRHSDYHLKQFGV